MGFFDLILLFCWGCGKSGGGVGVQRLAWPGPGLGFGLPGDGCEGDGGVLEGGVEGCFRAPGSGKLDSFDHKWYLRLQSFSHCILIVRQKGLIICKWVTRVCAPLDSGQYGVYRGVIRCCEEFVRSQVSESGPGAPGTWRFFKPAFLIGEVFPGFCQLQVEIRFFFSIWAISF